MHSPFWSSPLGRVIVGLGVFTFAFWALAAAAFFAWSPGRGIATAAASHFDPHPVHASDAVRTPGTVDDSCAALCDHPAGCSYSYSTGTEDDPDFAWAVLDADGRMTVDGGEADDVRARVGMLEARLVADCNLSSTEIERQRETLRGLRGQLRELQAQLDRQQREHTRSQRELSRRTSGLSSRYQDALREARTPVRSISRRARREGKAERPHANA
jgi:hypothetical protein